MSISCDTYSNGLIYAAKYIISALISQPLPKALLLLRLVIAVAVQADVDKGESEAVGDQLYQQIDQSKLVPLLTAALQEEVAKREELEARVASLESAIRN